VNPSIVRFANVAAVDVDVEDLIATELLADIDHLSRFGDAVREHFTVQPADKDLWRRCAERDWQPACPTMVQSRVSVEAIPSFASSCASSVARATKRECLEKSDQGCGAARVQQNMNLLADVEDNAGVVPASDRVRSPSDLVDYHLRTFGATRQGRRD
jgi:hypothetical protein